MARPAFRQRPNHTPTVSQSLRRCALTSVTAFLLVTACSAQNVPPKQPAATAKKPAPAPTTANQSSAAPSPESQFSNDLKKYPGLLPALSDLLQKLQQGIQSPAPRTQSRLLPLLPESTIAYAALPNYGDVAHQVLAIFRQELQQSAVLRDWWTHGSPAASGPKIEQFFERFDQLNEYLGDEVVVSGSTQGEHQSTELLAIAEIRKPGLDKFLQQWINEQGGESKVGVTVLDESKLDHPLAVLSKNELLVLVRPDVVVVASDLTALRAFDDQLKAHTSKFAATPFAQRIAQEYPSGVTLLGAADVQKILRKIPVGPQSNDKKFQDSGFADMKYALWKQTKSNGQSVSQGELSFTGPRHGAAAWLGEPVQLNSLDFVSPQAMFALTFVFSSFPQIFDDVKGLAEPANSNIFGAIEGGQKALNLNLKQDLLAQLAGEFTIELDSLTDKLPAAKIIFKVNDAAHLQKTLTTLLAAAQMPLQHVTDGPVPYDTVRIPNQTGPMPMAYAFVDGYWILASKPETLLEALRLHAAGGSLAHSPKFVAALPAGSAGPPRASGLFYHDPATTFDLQMRQRQASPEIAQLLALFMKDAPASLARFYGDDSAIRAASNSRSIDIGTILIVAAVAIPNLLRSRMATNEASAVGSLRTLNTAEITYSMTYPKRGFARNMAALGVDPSPGGKVSEAHAGLLDRSLANETCTRDVWCSKSGYNFRITTECTSLEPCREYLAVATPVDANTGTRSFCSTSDGIIRHKLGVTTATPLTASQCRAWPPLK